VFSGRVVDLGVLDYREAYRQQLDWVKQRQQHMCEDTLLLVEHPHVITLGRSRKARANVVAPGDIEVVEIERGGDATYHGPGQLVAYPILLLREGERDMHAYLRLLEQAIIVTLTRFNLAAYREAGKTGVWIQNRKIASIGVACRRWVTFHGLALNVTTDLSRFRAINPCGFPASIMTSIAAELGHRTFEANAVKNTLTQELGLALRRSWC